MSDRCHDAYYAHLESGPAEPEPDILCCGCGDAIVERPGQLCHCCAAHDGADHVILVGAMRVPVDDDGPDGLTVRGVKPACPTCGETIAFFRHATDTAACELSGGCCRSCLTEFPKER